MKEEKKITYNIFKVIVGGLSNLYYRPKYFNKDMIPKNGPIILCGNHMHLFDQNFACMSTKRMVHYMAKIEYLKSKFAWFFKGAGCIFVDREAHDGKAKNAAISLLEEGYAIGLFPEGTRNQISCRTERLKELYEIYKNDISYDDFVTILKNNAVKTSQVNKLIELKDSGKITDIKFKEYVLNADKALLELVKENIISNDEYIDTLLLPLKFGAVSMAQKTGATIVPFAITGKYRFRKNHLNIRFGSPFKVEESTSLEDANKELRKIMLNLQKEGIDFVNNKLN